MGLDDLVYGLYERRLAHDLDAREIPRHVGVILDGNRRWASEQGSSSDAGHRAGAAKIAEFLDWCDEVGVQVVTMASSCMVASSRANSGVRSVYPSA